MSASLDSAPLVGAPLLPSCSAASAVGDEDAFVADGDPPRLSFASACLPFLSLGRLMSMVLACQSYTSMRWAYCALVLLQYIVRKPNPFLAQDHE